MSDLDTIRAMLDNADVRYRSAAPRPGDNTLRPGTATEVYTAGGNGSIQGPDLGEGNLGYLGFYSVFGFDADGTLISVGAWE